MEIEKRCRFEYCFRCYRLFVFDTPLPSVYLHAVDPDVRFAGPLISLSVSSTAPVPFDILHAIRPPLRFLQTRITPPIIPPLTFLCTVFLLVLSCTPSCWSNHHASCIMNNRRCAGTGTVKPLMRADCAARRCETRRWKTNRFFVYMVLCSQSDNCGRARAHYCAARMCMALFCAHARPLFFIAQPSSPCVCMSWTLMIVSQVLRSAVCLACSGLEHYQALRAEETKKRIINRSEIRSRVITISMVGRGEY